MKFGGTSVGDAARIRGVADIVKAALPRKPIVVVSAHKGITDDLLRAAHRAAEGDEAFEPIKTRHRGIARDLGVDPAPLEELFGELEFLLKGIALVRQITPRTLDYAMSFGERLSARTIAAYFTKAGMPAKAWDAFDLGLVTDENFGNARPLPEADAILYEKVRKAAASGIPVVTGYIGKTKRGDVSTLGRNGSDYSASIVGAGAGVEEIQIWTDVDGVLSTDPKRVPHARLLPHLSFEEARELAYFGGKVIHPATMLPAVRKGIPLKVLNTFNPTCPGTTITSGIGPSDRVIKSIAFLEDQSILTATTDGPIIENGTLSKVFAILAKHRVPITVIATSEASVSVTVDGRTPLDEPIAEIRTFAETRVEPGKALVCVVGQGMKGVPGLAGKVFSVLGQAKVNIGMISQGASEYNITFVVDGPQLQPALLALHKEFCE